MAIEKVVKISVDQVQAAGGLEKFTEGLKKSEKSANSLRTELKNLKQQLAELPEGTAKYNEIAKKAGEVSDKISDISTRVKNLGSDTKNIDAVVQGAQTLSGAFTVASSASALFGSENEDLQKSMAKVEAAIGLTVGIQSISNALQKESALYIGISNLATKIQIGLQVAYATVVGTTTGALKALRVALVSTGVGALVVALGFLVSKMSESADATEDQAKAQLRLNDELEKSNKLFAEELKGIDYVTNARKLRAQIAGKGEKELQQIEKEAHEERLKAIDDEQNRLLKQLDDKKNSVETSKKINEALAKNNQAFIDEVNSSELKGLEKSLEIKNKKRDAEKKAEEEQKRTLEEQFKERDENLKQQGRVAEDAYAKMLKDRIDSLDEELTAIIDFDERELENSQKKINALADKDLQIANNSKLSFDERLNAVIERENLEKDIVFKNQDDKTAYEKANSEARVEIAKAEADAKQKSLEGYASAIEQVSGVIGTQTAIGKTIAVASSLINTYAAITGQLKAFSGVPIPGYAIAQAIATGVVGFANVAKIVSIKVPKSSGGGGLPSGASAGGSGGGTTAPNFNIVGQNSNNQLAQSISQKQSQPVQAYVVSGNVSNAQSLDRNRIDTATFN